MRGRRNLSDNEQALCRQADSLVLRGDWIRPVDSHSDADADLEAMTATGGEMLMNDDDLITVCDKCLQASCWQGNFMCDESRTAGVLTKTRKELNELKKHMRAYPRTDWQTDLFYLLNRLYREEHLWQGVREGKPVIELTTRGADEIRKFIHGLDAPRDE